MPAWRIPKHDEEHADAREDRPDRVEGAGRVGRQRVDEAAAEQDDRPDDERLEDERRAPADPGGDHAADQRSRGGADAPSPLITPNAQARDVRSLNHSVARM